MQPNISISRQDFAQPGYLAGLHFRSGAETPPRTRPRKQPARYVAAGFRGGAVAAVTLEVLRCLLILALAQCIAMPLRGLNTAIEAHVKPGWPIVAPRPHG